jgi:hypothetical protein
MMNIKTDPVLRLMFPTVYDRNDVDTVFRRNGTIGTILALIHLVYAIPYDPEASAAIVIYKMFHFSAFPWDMNLYIGLIYLIVSVLQWSRVLKFMALPYVFLVFIDCLSGFAWHPPEAQNVLAVLWILALSNAVAGAWAWMKLVMWSIRDRRNRRNPDPEVFD